MSRPWQIWTAFAFALAVVVGALAFVSVTVTSLERDGLEAAQRAEFEENVRLALWRLDSSLTPLLAQENGRPYFTWSAFYPAERAYTRMFSELERGEVLVPSPLLVETPEFIHLHFQLEPDGTFRSPQAPTGNMRDLAEAGYTSHEAINSARDRLAALEQALHGVDLVALLPPASASDTLPPVRIPDVVDAAANSNPAIQDQQGGNDYNSWTQAQNYRGTPRSQAEYGARANTINRQLPTGSNANLGNGMPMQQDAGDEHTHNQPGNGDNGEDCPPEPNGEAVAVPAPGNVTEGRMRPLWIGDRLLLARRVAIDDREFVQGCWLDWPAVRAMLVQSVADVLPDASLQPETRLDTDDANGTGNGQVAYERMLTVLPVRLDPGAVPVVETPDITPATVTLGVSWVAVLLAAVAVWLLLSGTLSLSERRASFVSAVTHEMRTPLTTFRLYSDMLASGRVTDDAKRERYLGTLCSESTRLAHLVENVLAWARLERGRKRTELETVAAGDILDNAVGPLRERAERAGLELTVTADDEARAAVTQVNASAVDQVLFNLVENACKYATGTDDKRLDLQAETRGREVWLRVRDHGPGIPSADHGNLFRPFRKSSTHAADTTPGVGLGLALSRRLVRAMGGDLRHERDVTDGASFVVSLPRANTTDG